MPITDMRVEVMRCSKCGDQWTRAEEYTRCPTCNSGQLQSAVICPECGGAGVLLLERRVTYQHQSDDGSTEVELAGMCACPVCGDQGVIEVQDASAD